MPGADEARHNSPTSPKMSSVSAVGIRPGQILRQRKHLMGAGACRASEAGIEAVGRARSAAAEPSVSALATQAVEFGLGQLDPVIIRFLFRSLEIIAPVPPSVDRHRFWPGQQLAVLRAHGKLGCGVHVRSASSAQPIRAHYAQRGRSASRFRRRDTSRTKCRPPVVWRSGDAMAWSVTICMAE